MIINVSIKIKITKACAERCRLTCVRSFVYIECRFLRESLEAYVTLVGALAGMGAVVDLQVLLAGEGGRALQTLEGPPLHCGRATRLAHCGPPPPRVHALSSSPHTFIPP